VGASVVNGEEGDLAKPKRLPAIRRNSIGFVFQQYNLFPALTAVENVEYALNIKGIDGAKARSEAQRLIDTVGLQDRSDFLPRDVSGGPKQRIAIARAMRETPS
jgi:putative ABC transport system ATP-binding protein